MPGLEIVNGGFLKDILKLINAKDFDCNWLITDLDCHDYCDWNGCEKWSKKTLFLSNEEFLYDINLRNMQLVWGIVTAIPSKYKKEEVMSYPLPTFEDNLWNTKNTVYTQHPLALIEIASMDSTYLTVISKDEVLLKPLYALSDKVIDLELKNKKVNSAFKRVDNILKELNLKEPNNLKFNIWQNLFKDNNSPVPEETLKNEIMKFINR